MILDFGKRQNKAIRDKMKKYSNVNEGYDMGYKNALAEVEKMIDRLPSSFWTQNVMDVVIELKSKLHHSQQTKPFKVGLEDEKQGSLDTTDISRKEGYIAEMPEDKPADPRKRTENLKTLKDLKEFSLSHESFEDIKHGVLIDQFVSRNQLRQEAIKWIKYRIKISDGLEIEKIVHGPELCAITWAGEQTNKNLFQVGAIQSLVEVFNITEEMLK